MDEGICYAGTYWGWGLGIHSFYLETKFLNWDCKKFYDFTQNFLHSPIMWTKNVQKADERLKKRLFRQALKYVVEPGMNVLRVLMIIWALRKSKRVV